MMKKLLFILLMTAVTGRVAEAQLYWANQSPPFLVAGYFNDLEATSQTNVWAALFTDDGAGGFTYSRSFARTIDGGNNWTISDVSSTNTSLIISNIWPVDNDTCYVAMTSLTVGGGEIWKTTDGGTTWSQTGANTFQSTGSFANIVYFSDALNGMVIGDPIGPSGNKKYEIWLTNDAGSTWTQVPSANLPALVNQSEYGITNLFSSVPGHIWFGTTYGDVYHSSDGGQSWTKNATGVPANLVNGNRQDISDISFSDPMNGILYQLPATDPFTMYSTTDGGTSWTLVNYNGIAYPGEIEAVPGTSVFMCTGSNNVYGFGSSMSNDLGVNWSFLDTGISMTAVDFYDSGHGWAGEVTQPLAGGAWTWIDPFLLSTKPGVNLQSDLVAYPNPGSGIINIDLKNKSNAPLNLEVFNMLGEVVYSESFSGMLVKRQVDLTALPAGVYEVSLVNGSGKNNLKLVIQ